MFRKLVLAASAAAALGVSAIAFSAPAQARDFDRGGSAYDLQHERHHGYRRWDDDEDGYRRPHQRWGWRSDFEYARPHFAYDTPRYPYWEGQRRPWIAPRPVWTPPAPIYNEPEQEW